MQVLAGTSGFAYKEWKGSFYPEKIANDKMLAYYAEHFGTVEINNTFYRLPSRSLLERWSESVPDDFSFVLKASRKITHRKDIEEAKSALSYLLETIDALGDKLGPILFQFPPYLKKSPSRIGALLEMVPGNRMAACEFRHETWFDDEIYELLREHKAALVGHDGAKVSAPVLTTTNWGYLRMRSDTYSDQELGEWAGKVKEQAWERAYAFFKHEDEGAGPKIATKFLQQFD